VRRNGRHIWRTALIALGLALLPACSHRGSGLVSTLGVIWDRITPPQVVEPDRPDWMGDSIAFQVRVLSVDGVAVARADGSALAIQPGVGATNERAPRWVRSGLLLDTSDFSGSEDLWYREAASGVTHRLTGFAGGEWTPAPRPIAPGIVYVEGAVPDSGRLVLLADTTAAPLNPIYLTPASLGAGEPDWNPAGDQICFSATGPGGTRQIWRLSLSDTLAVQITVAQPAGPDSVPTIDRSPRWSPDGTKVLFASNRSDRWGAWTVSPLGEAQGLDVVAQDGAGAEIRHPVWSPDGTKILLSSNRSGDRALWRLSNLP
jgi:Tol biopolymer transport system component